MAAIKKNTTSQEMHLQLSSTEAIHEESLQPGTAALLPTLRFVRLCFGAIDSSRFISFLAGFRKFWPPKRKGKVLQRHGGGRRVVDEPPAALLGAVALEPRRLIESLHITKERT